MSQTDIQPALAGSCIFVAYSGQDRGSLLLFEGDDVDHAIASLRERFALDVEADCVIAGLSIDAARALQRRFNGLVGEPTRERLLQLLTKEARHP